MLDEPEIWALLEDGEELVSVDGRLGPYRDGNYIVRTGGYYIGEMRDDDGIGRSWAGSDPLVKRDGNWTVDITSSSGRYRRDGDNIKDISGRVVAWVRKRR